MEPEDVGVAAGAAPTAEASAEAAPAEPTPAAAPAAAPPPPRAPPPRKIKLVVRMLPPKLSEADFKSSIEAWAARIDWSRFEAGAVPDEPGRPIQFGCAYLRFTSAEARLLGCSLHIDITAHLHTCPTSPVFDLSLAAHGFVDSSHSSV